MFNLYGCLTVSAVLFVIGIYGILSRRNTLMILMSLELIFNAATLNFVAFNRFLYPQTAWGQAAVLFVIAAAAAEAVVGLALILTVYRSLKTIFAEDLNILKG